ncbi:hypothetical protein EHO60_11530 [Leptospira fletcheri]|uniref:Lipoprotein n=1 Tax=Leptospira fletcheri TaxID=2484981 RepID=A0A4R9GE09_9LEPT|nr:hypothetical protein [Leptospira fletcheri]TGK09981.1 hypothetical protein EHO60_11530 [Leptospira fletcheri]
MNRDILKTLLGGLLILLLGCLIVYVIFQRDKISTWVKSQQSTPGESAPNERVIIGLDELPQTKETTPPSQNFDSELSPNKEIPKEIPKPLPKTDYEVPGLGPEVGKTKPSERSENSKREEPSRTFAEDEPSRWKEKHSSESAKFDESNFRPSPKETSYRKNNGTKRKHSLVKKRSRLTSLEKRVDRLEKKLGVKKSKQARSKKKPASSLEKRVERLEKEVSTLKKKSKEE